jgi:MFS transporter, DHA1 family, multidrug resistance protein
MLQALFGIGAGGLIPAANAIIADRTTPERRGAVFGVTASVGAIGSFIGPLVGAGIAATLGFPATFAFTGLVLIGLAAFLAYAIATGLLGTESDRRTAE